jgi:hypothetical protein
MAKSECQIGLKGRYRDRERGLKGGEVPISPVGFFGYTPVGRGFWKILVG